MEQICHWILTLTYWLDLFENIFIYTGHRYISPFNSFSNLDRIFFLFSDFIYWQNSIYLQSFYLHLFHSMHSFCQYLYIPFHICSKSIKILRFMSCWLTTFPYTYPGIAQIKGVSMHEFLIKSGLLHSYLISKSRIRFTLKRRLVFANVAGPNVSVYMLSRFHVLIHTMVQNNSIHSITFIHS